MVGILPYINMTVIQDHCCINCSWTQPPTIEGIPVIGYQYNITTVDGVLTNTITDTFIQYCPQAFGDYTVSLAGVNGAGLGEINEFNATLQPCKLNLNDSDHFSCIFVYMYSYYCYPCC